MRGMHSEKKKANIGGGMRCMYVCMYVYGGLTDLYSVFDAATG